MIGYPIHIYIYIYAHVYICQPQLNIIQKTASAGAHIQAIKDNNLSLVMEEKKNRKIVYFINSVQSCKDDVTRLIPAFRNLGYETKIFENPSSYQSLQDELDKLDNRATIKEAIIICHGYGFPGKYYNDYIYIGNDALSYQMFC